MLKSNIDINIQFHILSLQGGEADSYLRTTITHGTNIGQKSVIGERRYTDVVQIEHIRGFGIIIIKREKKPVAKHTKIYSRIESAFYFPLQIGIGITHITQSHHLWTTDRYHSIGFHQIKCRIGVNATLIAG